MTDRLPRDTSWSPAPPASGAGARSYVARTLDRWATERGDDAALVVVGPEGTTARLSWRELRDRAGRTGDELCRRVPRGGHVAVLHRLEPDDLVVAVLGAWRAGLAPMPVDPAMPPERVERLAALQRSAPAGPRGSRPAYVLATGGSTGEPRPVAAPGPFGDDEVERFARMLRPAHWRPGRSQLVVGAVHHATAFRCAFFGLLQGGTVVLLARFDPRLAVDALRYHGVRWMQLTPYQMRAIADAPGAARAVAPLAGVLHTSAPCPAGLKRWWLDQLGPEQVWELYSSSEAVGATLCSGREWSARPGTVGRGVGTRIRIVDEHGAPCPPHRVGRVFMRTARRDAVRALAAAGMARVTPDGYASVGDLGWLDPEGYLYLAGREDDVVNVGGAKVSSREVEDTLRRHRDVVDVAVVATPHDRLGQVPVGVVEVRPGCDRTRLTTELDDICRAGLLPVARPRRLVLEDELPRGAGGKVLKGRLRAALAPVRAACSLPT